MKRLILSVPKIFIVFAFFSCFNSYAQSDTVRLNLQDAEKQFLQKNLRLIAEKYNIDINKAAVRQAKLWDNPNFQVSTNVYDGSKYPFYHGSSNNGGQIDLQWSQLFKIGGQRKKLSSVLSDNSLIAEEQFNDLMNNLRYTLRNDFYTLAGLLENKRLYTFEMSRLQPLVTGMDIQLQSGNISARDNIRIKALSFDLQSDIFENEKSIAETASELRELLHTEGDTFIFPVMNFDSIPAITFSSLQVDSLFDIAKNNRPDYRAALLQASLQQHNLSYQKSLGVPDLSIGTEYDKLNSYAKNYVGLSMAMQLPLFNRNQANVQVAKIAVQQQNAQKDLLEGKIRNDIYGALDKLSIVYHWHDPQQIDFIKKYDELLGKMTDSYQNKQVSLLEFIDFLDAYKETKSKIIEQDVNIKKSIEDLNYTCGTKIIQN